MRNIRKPIKRVLLNTLTYADAQLYEDYNRGVMVLKLADGTVIEGQPTTGTKASPAEPVIGAGGLGAGLQVAKHSTDSGSNELLFIKFAPPDPITLTAWPYALTIGERVKMPGVRNSKTNFPQHKTYGGNMNVAVSGGSITDATVKLMEDDLIKQIRADLGLHNINQDPITKMSGAVVDALRAYEFTGFAADANITFTWEDGTTTTVSALGATALLAAAAINANSTVNPLVLAVAKNTTTVLLIAKTNGLLYTVADGGGVSTITIGQRYLALKAKSVDVQFDCLVDPYSMGTTFYRRSIITLTGAGTGTGTITVDGTTTGAITESTTEATWAGNINTALNAAGLTPTEVYASYDTALAEIYVYMEPTFKNFRYTPATGTAYVTDKWMGWPMFPQLTADDVFRMFSNQLDGGYLSNLIRLGQPSQVDFNVYYIKNNNLVISSLHGAGYNQTAEAEYEIYIPKSLCDDLIWDAGRGQYTYVTAPVTADTSWETLLGIFTGLAVASW